MLHAVHEIVNNELKEQFVLAVSCKAQNKALNVSTSRLKTVHPSHSVLEFSTIFWEQGPDTSHIAWQNIKK